MKKKGQLTLGLIFAMLVIVVVGVALLNSSAESVSVMTQKQSVTDETTNLSTSCYAGGQVNESLAACNITVSAAPTGWKTTECPLESVVVSNATGTALVLDTDYNLFASTGIVKMLNTTDTNATNLGENVLIDYSYCADGYNTSSGSRSIATVIIVFFALAIAFAVLEKSGITNLTGWFN